MPEALVVFAVCFVSVVIWIGAWLQTRGRVTLDSPDELARLRHHEAWLRQRLALAQRERWSADMIDSLAGELRVTAQNLARASGTGRADDGSSAVTVTD